MDEERRDPPLEMMAQLHALNRNLSPEAVRPIRARHNERIRQVLRADPEMADHIAGIPTVDSISPIDTLEKLDHLFDRAAADRSPPDFSQGPALQVLVPPYHYGGRNQGNARMFPDPDRGTIGLGARAGNVDGVDDDRQEGICWIGVGLFSSQTIQVRVAPMVFWKSMWTLSVAGVVVFTSSPWADWKAWVQTQAYDSAGAATPLLIEQLVHRRKREAPGGWAHDDSWDSGTAPTMHTFLTIPAGTTRWFNVLAHGIAEVDYTFENSAAAQCGMDLNVNLIVVERL